MKNSRILVSKRLSPSADSKMKSLCQPELEFSETPGGVDAQNLKLKHTNVVNKEANDPKTNDSLVNKEKLSYQGACGRQFQQENYNVWSTFSPNFSKEVHRQSHPCDVYFYPSIQGQFFPAHLFLHQVLPLGQNYSPPEYLLQDFDYFVVIDFEATCDRDKRLHPQEIIEFPSVLVNSRTGQLEDCFQIYVRPTHNQLLTDFCKELTGIQQAQVDEGVLLSEALLMHDKWLEDKGIKHSSFAIVTWSNWDCQVILESECRFKSIMKPAYFNRWINLRNPFCKVFDRKRRNLKEAVEFAGLTWEGRAHCGLDDAKNTARLLANLMYRGVKLSITDTILWESADNPLPHLTQTPNTRDYGLYSTYQPPKYNKSLSTPPFQTIIPGRKPVFCYCGATSIKRFLVKTGSTQGNMFFVCGNSTVDGAAMCPFLKLTYESRKTA